MAYGGPPRTSLVLDKGPLSMTATVASKTTQLGIGDKARVETKTSLTENRYARVAPQTRLRETRDSVKVASQTSLMKNRNATVSSKPVQLGNRDTTRVTTQASLMEYRTARTASEKTQLETRDKARAAPQTSQIENKSNARVASELSQRQNIIENTTRAASQTTRMENRNARVASQTSQLKNRGEGTVVPQTSLIENRTARTASQKTLIENRDAIFPPETSLRENKDGRSASHTNKTENKDGRSASHTNRTENKDGRSASHTNRTENKDGRSASHTNRTENKDGRSASHTNRTENKDGRSASHTNRTENKDGRSASHTNRTENKDGRSASHTNRTENKDGRSASHTNRTENKDGRSASHTNRTENKDGRSASHTNRTENKDGRSTSHTNRTENKDGRSASHTNRTENKDGRSASHTNRTENKDERSASHTNRTENKDGRSASHTNRTENKDGRSTSHTNRTENIYARGASQRSRRGGSTGYVKDFGKDEKEINRFEDVQMKKRGRGRGRSDRGVLGKDEEDKTRSEDVQMNKRGRGRGRSARGFFGKDEKEINHFEDVEMNKRGRGRGRSDRGVLGKDEEEKTHSEDVQMNKKGRGRGRSDRGFFWKDEEEKNHFEDVQMNKRGRGRGRSGRGASRGWRRLSTERSTPRDKIQYGNTRDKSGGVVSGDRGRGRRGGLSGPSSLKRKDNSEAGINDHILKSWSENKNSEEVLIEICNTIESVEKLLASNSMPEDWYTRLVQVFTSVITCQHHTQKLKKVLKAISTSHFLTHHLMTYLDLKEIGETSWTGALGFFNYMVKIVQQILKELPEHAQICKSTLRYLLRMTELIEPVRENKDLKILLSTVWSAAIETHKSWTERQSASRSHRPSLDSEKPPEDFRDLSVIPTISDLSPDVKPFVRAIITKGAYKDQEHYLDIQFRLMREDFIQPLRNGIKEYREHGQDKNFRNSHIRIYNDVHFIGMTHINGINHVVQFDVKNMKHVKWDHSKRLLNGSLVCLSNDNFNSVLIFATVSFRDINMLRKGIVDIVCHSELETVLNTSSKDAFVMAETMAYYEAVHPVLKGLQAIDSDLPLKKYIISCEKLLKPPSYLLGGVRKYDITCMMKTSRNTEVSLLNTSMWPQVKNMCLNPSQRDAAILALTKEMSVIQGPPGTGKTYVGLKVMQVLLTNKRQMLSNENSKHDPILVVCYTNHALDQFLEGIIPFCPDGIIRVGGKSSSEELEKLNLKNVKKNRRKAWGFSTKALRNSLEEYSKKIEDTKQEMDSLATDILGEHKLSKYMLSKHYDSLETGPYERRRKSQIHQWLNASNKSLLQTLPGMIKHHMVKLVMKYLQLKTKIDSTLDFNERLPIAKRVQVYRCWLQEYQSVLKTNLEDPHGPTLADKHYFSSLYHRSFRPFILNDSEILMVIHPEFFARIAHLVNKHTSQFEDHDQIVEGWVLGLNKEFGDQLNDVERLTHFVEKFIKPEEEDEEDEFDDKEESQNAINQRQCIEDEDDEKKNFNATLKVTKEGAFLLNKARLLGISEDTEANDVHHNDSADGFRTVTYKKQFTFSQVEKFLSNERMSPVSNEAEQSIVDLWSLDMKTRFTLYKRWIKRYKEYLVNKIQVLIQKYTNIKKELTETRNKEDIDILKQAKVIGMTTTGAAKKRAWLEAIGCRIIVVEEAAEVLEAHIVTALNQNLKHLILIGDHQQLRPKPTVYEHAKNFGLDVSLFERLVNNGIPHVTLSEQHRMRESISVVMRHIYPDLQDHISVKGYEHIHGISKDIFFIQHDHLEESVKDTLSKSNPFEAEYLIRLCQYFLLQGYEPSQITILATYAGQVLALKKEMNNRNLTPEVRITPVDSFQGEENDIILLSLVRSNEKNIAGFLKVDNRVCVALSRAKKGMFAIGNIKLLASQSSLWKKILETAEERGITGNGLPISCRNHPDEKNVIRDPNDFDCSPEGGCLKKCDFRLDCGHVCHLTCHGYNLEHEDFNCLAPCDKSCPEGHRCQKQCWDTCGDCFVRVQKLISACGHSNIYPCSQDPNDTDCYSRCEMVLPCGHRCTGKCGGCKRDGKHQQCQVPVTYFWPCDHAVEVPCHFKPSDNPCPQKCGETLKCGHVCTGKCSDCLRGAVHIACKMKCTKILTCGHKCQSSCSVLCPPCMLPCPVRCRHGPCRQLEGKHTCGQPCSSCQKPCMNDCHHTKCSQECFEKCDRKPCERRCLKTVKNCGHQCSGLCGEICVCANCQRVYRCQESKPKDKTISQGRESSLVLKIPSCGHIFYLDEIDEYVSSMNERNSTEFICCPQCSTPIQMCGRYDAVLKDNSRRREEEKKILQKRHRLSYVQWNKITDSLELVQNKDTGFLWLGLCNLDEELTTAGEIQAVSFKLKFAYVISEIMSLEQQDQSNTGNELKERVSALFKTGNYMSSQQIEEYIIDLKRLLILEYSNALITNAEKYALLCLDEITACWATLRDKLKQPISSHALVEECMDICTTMASCIELESTYTAKDSLETVRRCLEVLDSGDEMMLIDVICDGRHGNRLTGLSRSSIEKDLADDLDLLEL